MELSGGPRWKGGQANPMSEIVSQLRTSLTQSKTILSGCAVVLEVDAEVAELLGRSSIGQGFTNIEEDKHGFQLAPEESFYMCYALKCIKILRKDNNPHGIFREVGDHFGSQRTFLELHKVYPHLRSKNWVVRSGTHYGADFAAYNITLHLSMPNMQCWLYLCCSGSVAKDIISCSLEELAIEEQVIRRWK